MKDFKEPFKALAKAKQITSVHIVQRAILKAMKAKTATGFEDRLKIASSILSKAFTPVSRQILLDNGVDPMRAIRDATWRTKHYYADNVLGNNRDLFESEDELIQYKNLAVALYEKYKIPSNYYSRQYVYTFVRQDMSPEYQLVQASHAAAKMGHRLGRMALEKKGAYEPNHFDELYFCVVGVKDLQALVAAMKDCQARKMEVYPFIEPDIGNIMTAFSTSPIWASDRKGLLSYKKLRFG